MYRVAMHVMFDAVINVLIILNMIPIIIELTADDDSPYLGVLKTINYVYCAIYLIEAIWKVSDQTKTVISCL
jgi:sodium/hydrogen exchanger 10/11